MEKIESNDLLKIGFTKGEAKVYLSLIEIGSSTVGPIVKRAGVAYSKVYEILNRLIKKGVVSYITKNKTKYFQAISPRNLSDYLDKKEREIILEKESLQKLIPKLEKLQDSKSKQDAEIFLGKKGLKTSYIKLLSDSEKKEEHLFLYSHEEEYAKESDLFYISIQDVLKNNNIKGISNKEYKKSEYLRQARYIKLKTIDSPLPGNIDIHNDKILLVSWKAPITAILIHSKDMANNLKKYFNCLWKIAKK